MRNRIFKGVLVASTELATNIIAKYSDIQVVYKKGIFGHKIISRNTIDRKPTIIKNNKGSLSSQISAFKRRYRER